MTVNHETFSPMLLDDEWYAECDCGEDYVGTTEAEVERWCDEHSRTHEAPTQASVTQKMQVLTASASASNFYINVTPITIGAK